MSFSVLAGGGDVPDFHMVFILCSSNASPNALYNADKALSGFQKNQIKNNVRKIAGEWHLGDDWMKEKFKIFRDVYLRVFPNFKILSFDGIDITWQVWNPEFIPYYREIMIFIDNRD